MKDTAAHIEQMELALEKRHAAELKLAEAVRRWRAWWHGVFHIHIHVALTGQR